MASRIQRLCGSHALLTTAIAEELVNSQHRALLESHPWSRRKQEIAIATAADKDDGTVSVTQGSATVTGSGTAFASTDVGRYIRISSSGSLYVVRTYVSATSITLGDLNGTAVNYADDTDTGLSYVLFTRWYSLGTAIEQINAMYQENKINERDLEFLDGLDPERSSTGTPRYFARGPRDMSSTSDLVRIEFWPRPDSPIVISGNVQKGHTDFSSASTSNPIVPSGPVEWFAAMDGCHFLFAKTKEQKWLVLADRYEKRGEISLEREKVEDGKKFGQSPAIKDVGGGVALEATDWGVEHDGGF